MTNPARQSEGFEFVNLLRGAAALLVLYFHLYIFIFHQDANGKILPGTFGYLFVIGAIDLGKFAVGLFFIISGFLIPATLTRASSTLRDFVIHRMFRLYPAYWVSIIVFVAAALLFDHSIAIPTSVVLINLTMLQRFVGIYDLILPYWTLQIELIFYFLCALLFVLHKLERRRQILWLTLSAGLLCAVLRRRYHLNVPVGIPASLALMFLGDSIRAFSKKLISQTELITSTLLVAITLIPICLIGYVDDGKRNLLSYWIAIAVFLVSYRFASLFRNVRPIRIIGLFLGDCSYSIYLLQYPIGLRLAAYLFRTTQSQLITAAGAFGSTIACAYIVYRLIEAPGIRLGRKLTPQNRQPTPLLAVANPAVIPLP